MEFLADAVYTMKCTSIHCQLTATISFLLAQVDQSVTVNKTIKYWEPSILDRSCSFVNNSVHDSKCISVLYTKRCNILANFHLHFYVPHLLSFITDIHLDLFYLSLKKSVCSKSNNSKSLASVGSVENIRLKYETISLFYCKA